ncbi:tyrosine-protein phosphatase [Streptomyces nitrosporeus]|uniref:Tyrosine-protein phosphatase n=1 Tax=Streptomyces nitrosporeus TaxID=28894 RepID=A0A5J6FHJ0_9ACTN|nr:tyrosine-protein phosphatase [Streptomyces nitrosporeus]QEU76059.1 tyrosine-protein phosphatase [Streptomyces nitrosporeus]GGZ07536.1 protein-tyrosine-phosphatase [Streptomyces nitrosporeus]
MQTARAVPASTVVNLRDLGGIALGRDRRLRQGILLRSGQLSDFDAEHDIAVAALGIRTVVDLRTADERQWAPDRLPPGARLFVADVLGDHPGVTQGRLRALLSDPAAAFDALGGGKAEGLFAQVYRKMVLAPGAAAAYRAFLETAADPGARPLLFHCATGKDRTGWATALLLLTAGASREVVRAEFLAVNRAARRAFGREVHRYLEGGGDPDIAAAITEVRPRYLDAALDAMDERWGGLEGYLHKALRVPQAVVDRLRADLVITA